MKESRKNKVEAAKIGRDDEEVEESKDVKEDAGGFFLDFGGGPSVPIANDHDDGQDAKGEDALEEGKDKGESKTISGQKRPRKTREEIEAEIKARLEKKEKKKQEKLEAKRKKKEEEMPKERVDFDLLPRKL